LWYSFFCAVRVSLRVKPWLFIPPFTLRMSVSLVFENQLSRKLYFCIKQGVMKTISLKINDEVAKAFMNLRKDELENLTGKVSDWIKAKSQFAKTLDALQEETEKNGLTPDVLADILEMDKEEKSNLFGTTE